MPCASGVSSGFLIFFAAAIAPAQEASHAQLTARELFYAAVETKQPTQPAKAANRPKRPPVASQGAPVQNAQANALPEGGRLVPAAAPSEPPLGLKYWIMRRVSGKMMETPADSIFHTGDAIQLTIQTNRDGYLYIVNQGSSGAWKPLFPSPEIASGDNRVEAWHTYTLPPQHPMVFDEQTGTEKLTILFSRKPVTDFEELIYSLQDRQSNRQMVADAQMHIDDATVGRLREASTRDLIIEKVDPATPPDSGSAAVQKETAVYVVNPMGSVDSKLAADLHLVHR